MIGTRGLRISPARYERRSSSLESSSTPKSYTFTRSTACTSSYTAIFLLPITVMVRSFDGASHERCACASAPDGKPMVRNTTSSISGCT